MRLDAPGGWFDRKTGEVDHEHPTMPGMFTVELDEGGRALARVDEIVRVEL